GVKLAWVLMWTSDSHQRMYSSPTGGSKRTAMPPGIDVTATPVGLDMPRAVTVSRGVNGALTPSLASLSSQASRLTTTLPAPIRTMLQSVDENDNSRPSIA